MVTRAREALGRAWKQLSSEQILARTEPDSSAALPLGFYHVSASLGQAPQLRLR
jgi:hypothetical protein